RGRRRTVDERLGRVGVVAAVAVQVLVRLLEREEMRAVEGTRRVARGGVGHERPGGRRRDVDRPRADAERGRGGREGGNERDGDEYDEPEAGHDGLPADAL